jgi:hypothetical protein
MGGTGLAALFVGLLDVGPASPKLGPPSAPSAREVPIMSKWVCFMTAVMLAVAGQTNAANLGFTGTLDTRIATLPSITVPGSGTATISGSNLTSLSIPAGAFSLASLSIPVTDPAVSPVVGIQAKNVKNGAGSFSLGGKMAVQGVRIVCLFASGVGCSGGPTGNLTVPFTANGTRGVGLGGAPIIVPKNPSGVSITVNGNPWTAGSAAINTGMGTVKIVGFIHGPASGGAATAGQVSGVVQLVTPIMISTTIGSSATLPSFGILNLHLVPEPTTLLLLVSGFAALAVVGRRRMSK